MRYVSVLSGVHGAGKTFLAKRMRDEFEASRNHRCLAKIVSAADHRSGPGDKGVMVNSHARCFREFIDVLQDQVQLVIVDNCGIYAADLAPYVLGAQAFGFSVEVVLVSCDPVVAWERNVHGHPLEKIMHQHEIIERERLPGRWRQRIVKS